MAGSKSPGDGLAGHADGADQGAGVGTAMADEDQPVDAEQRSGAVLARVEHRADALEGRLGQQPADATSPGRT